MRRHTGKIGFLFLALVIALGGLGVGFAAWTDSLLVQGEVNTGEVNWRVINPSCEAIVIPQELCEETAWALCDWDEMAGIAGVKCAAWCFDCPQGWGQYFKYGIGDSSLTLPLVAGQHTQIGTVTVETDDDNIIVEYSITEPDWTFEKSQLYVDNEPPRRCNPGGFPYSSDDDSSVIISDTVHRYEIPISDVCPGCCNTLYIAAHADVLHPCDVEGGEVSLRCCCPSPTPPPTPPPTPCPTPEPTVPPAEICNCEAQADYQRVIVTLDDVSVGCAGEVTFYVLNTGTIPIRVTNIVLNTPSGVEATLLTPGIIGMQIHPGQMVSCAVAFEVTAPGDYTFTITVHAVAWNLY